MTKSNFTKFLGTQPILIAGTERETYIGVVLRRSAKNTAFTADVAKLFGTVIVIDQDIIHSGRSHTAAGILTLSTYAKKFPEAYAAAHHKFIELAKRVDREQQKLERALAERSDNFREILFGGAQKALT